MNGRRGSAALVSQLNELGLSELEATTYVALVAHGSTTAYQLAQQISKPTANVYKAVSSLADKGAVVVQPGSKRLLTATAPDEFLGQLQHRHQELISHATRGLRSLHRPAPGANLYTLESVDGAFERARTMLRAAREIVVVDVFPRSLERLHTDIEAAAKRGVNVFVQAYAKPAKRVAHIRSFVIASQAESVLAHWNSEQLNLVADGREMLLALCDSELSRIVQAYWSNSLYLACMQHAGLLREHAFHQIQELLTSGRATPRRLQDIIRRNPTFHSTLVPGQRELASLVGRRLKATEASST
jgi:sugar-specific transcriptional regulator TrmB